MRPVVIGREPTWPQRLAVACLAFDIAVLAALGTVAAGDRTDHTTWADLERIAGEAKRWQVP